MLTCGVSYVTNRKCKTCDTHFHFLNVYAMLFPQKFDSNEAFFSSNTLIGHEFTLVSFKLTYGVSTNRTTEEKRAPFLTGCRLIDAPIKHWTLVYYFINNFKTIVCVTDGKGQQSCVYSNDVSC